MIYNPSSGAEALIYGSSHEVWSLSSVTVNHDACKTVDTTRLEFPTCTAHLRPMLWGRTISRLAHQTGSIVVSLAVMGAAALITRSMLKRLQGCHLITLACFFILEISHWGLKSSATWLKGSRVIPVVRSNRDGIYLHSQVSVNNQRH